MNAKDFFLKGSLKNVISSRNYVFLRGLGGMTLIEIVLYFTTIGLLLTAAMIFSLQLMHMYSLSGNLNELQANQDFISEKMISVIQSADGVNDGTSVFDNNQGVLSLTMQDSLVSPSIFSLSDQGDLFLTRWISNPVQLNSDMIVFDSLRFHKVAFLKAPDQIIIDATMSLVDNEIASLDKTRSFHITVSLRHL